jgi:hypothetical protein
MPRSKRQGGYNGVPAMRAEEWSTTPCAPNPQVSHAPRRRASNGWVPSVGAEARWLHCGMLVAEPGARGLVDRAHSVRPSEFLSFFFSFLFFPFILFLSEFRFSKFLNSNFCLLLQYSSDKNAQFKRQELYLFMYIIFLCCVVLILHHPQILIFQMGSKFLI